MTKCKECDTFQERLKRGQLCNECYNVAIPEVIRRNGENAADPPGEIPTDGDYWKVKSGAQILKKRTMPRHPTIGSTLKYIAYQISLSTLACLSAFLYF